MSRLASTFSGTIAWRNVLQDLNDSFGKKIACQRVRCLGQAHRIHHDEGDLFRNLAQFQVFTVGQLREVPYVDRFGLFRIEAMITSTRHVCVWSKGPAVVECMHPQSWDRRERIINNPRAIDGLPGAWLTDD